VNYIIFAEVCEDSKPFLLASARKDFFHKYFKQTNVYMVNTIVPSQETLKKIREVLHVSNNEKPL